MKLFLAFLCSISDSTSHGGRAMPNSKTQTPKTQISKTQKLTPGELGLLRLLLRGQTVGEAFALMQLTPDAGREMLAGLMCRQEVATPRQLLTRALVHEWVR